MLDPERLARHPERERIGLVIPVAPFGRAVPQEPWLGFARRTGIRVVIDGAASFEGVADSPQSYLGQIPVALSFHATKSFSTGEGGGVAAIEPALARRIGQALNFGFYGSRDSEMASINGKLSEYHAAIGLAELDEWDGKRVAWRGVAERYQYALDRAGLGRRAFARPDIAGCYLLFRCSGPEEAAHIRNALAADGIDFRSWYGDGLHRQTHFAASPRDSLENTDAMAPCLLGLPTAPDLSERAISRVVAAVVSGVSRGHA